MKQLLTGILALSLFACSGGASDSGKAIDQSTAKEEITEEVKTIEAETEAILQEENKIDDELNEMLNELK